MIATQKKETSTSTAAARSNATSQRPVRTPVPHPLIQKAQRETDYLVWTNIGC